jgi:hypothetical protein
MDCEGEEDEARKLASVIRVVSFPDLAAEAKTLLSCVKTSIRTRVVP